MAPDAACLAVTSSPTMVAANDPRGSSPTTASANRRHDMVTRAQGIPSVRSSASRSRAPGRHGIGAADAGDHTVDQLVDDLVDRQIDPAVVTDVAARLGQVTADDRVSMLVAPSAPMSLDELELALDPVRLGVDERAVHVPQDGSGSAGAVGPPGCGHASWRLFSAAGDRSSSVGSIVLPVIALGLLLVLVGFVLILPSGAMPGSAARRNIPLSTRLFTTRTRAPTASRHGGTALVQVLMGLVVMAAGMIIIAASG